ncbi:hypothetical protein JTE90_027978 [Oedothorax gibbosus]|uniref:Uncharacterized protein n=1 Tax=Oedothorax gibbosus TaxID=931172 RepID=A0AAV6VEU3_9ARAC|nr:hypothetical protein JTE90_027978 [Oedothorax gibbosus]
MRCEEQNREKRQQSPKVRCHGQPSCTQTDHCSVARCRGGSTKQSMDDGATPVLLDPPPPPLPGLHHPTHPPPPPR